MERVIVIACYKPKPGKQDALHQLLKTHIPRLKEQGLVTEQIPILMEAKDQTIIEVFEWKSAEAIERAHGNPVVLKMWEEFNEVCEYLPVSKIEETNNLFSEFSPIEIY